MTTDNLDLPLYYPGKTLADMERLLRTEYLTKSGWLESAETKLAVCNGKPLPWFTYGAIRFLEQQIAPSLSVFEYGGGQSTLFWAERVRQVVCVDHDPAFHAYVKPKLPENAAISLVEEHSALPAELKDWGSRRPIIHDPDRTTHTFRSGQLNNSFEGYALKVLEFGTNHFDIIVVDGMARVLSTWAAIQHFKHNGFIVFDNADREFYRPAFDMLDAAGYRRIDFWGMGPINPYEWCTAIYYQPRFFTGTRWFGRPAPAEARPQPPAIADKDATGILVAGFNRPYHLQATLESLRLQGQIGKAHVWIDGTQGRGEYRNANTKTLEIARRYPVKELHTHHGHLGIEKLMMDALEDMTERYDRVIVLEDDCFPLKGSIDAFEATLDSIKDRPDIYSVYGHHFGVEPQESADFPRFQGWGWAAHSGRIRALLPELRRLFLLKEQDYKAFVATHLTPEIRARLDITPGRNVLSVLAAGFSWDSATAFLTASAGLSHRRTPERTVINTGIVPAIGHFQIDSPALRTPPFNMITLPEAWSHFDQTTPPCNFEAQSYGLEGLDRIILQHLPEMKGFFIELGAHDGTTQSNSAILEAQGWRGLLIEANPGSYAKCIRTRPNAIVEHAACVAFDCKQDHVTITDVGLMSMTARTRFSDETKADWIARGKGFTGRPAQEIEVPATNITALLDKHNITTIDLLLLDVEGSEIDVLEGLDFVRYAPAYIVAEDAYDQSIAEYLSRKGYRLDTVLLERKYTRDCLYERTKTNT